jgi:hypothetical protein
MSTRVVRLLTFPLLLSVYSCLPTSAQVTVNYGSRVSSAAKPVPAGAIAAQLGFLQTSGGLGLLHLAGFRQMRLDAQLSNVFNTPNPPPSNWSIVDDVLKVVQQQGLQVMIVIDYTPGWLQQTPNLCPAGTSSYHSPPTDITAWAGLAGQVVDHMNTNFPGLVTDYGLCGRAGRAVAAALFLRQHLFRIFLPGGRSRCQS